jgi:hypothetical protein
MESTHGRNTLFDYNAHYSLGFLIGGIEVTKGKANKDREKLTAACKLLNFIWQVFSN